MKAQNVAVTFLAAALLGPLERVWPSQAAEEPGIFADFNTSLGSFTCRLEYTLAPRAVANFIGLATGDRAWVDEATGRVRQDPFFDGLVFHRVIADFMIQSGSRNSLGTDGPGYAVVDEFTASLRHDRPGILSMANSGPNSNGSQFFVTVAATPWLDGKHTVFGRVVVGQEAVNAISRVGTDTNNKPLIPVVLQRVTIRRVGAAAQAFDVHAQNLPVVDRLPLTITKVPGEVRVAFTNALYAESRFATSNDLRTWTQTTLGFDTSPPDPQLVRRPNAEPAQFYSVTRVQYPSSTFAPRLLHGRTLVLVFDGGLGILEILFDAAGRGTYTYKASGGTVTAYAWTQKAYHGLLWPIYYSDLATMTLRLDFTGATGGTFTGTAYAANPFAVSGTFTLSAP